MYPVIVGLICLASCALAQGPLPPVYRLPTNMQPVAYMLRLNPSLTNGSITGSVMIEILTTTNVNETLDSITLHLGPDATVKEDRVMLLDSSGEMVPIGGVQYNTPSTVIKIPLPDGASLLYGHLYMLSLEFTSQVNSELKGLFMGSYNYSSKYIASNFRPTYARNVFPCFDEPHFQAQVALQVLRPETYTTVFSTPLNFSSNPDAENMVLDTFMMTPPMSIHSLGLFISEVQPVSSMGVNVFAPAGTTPSEPALEVIISTITNALGPFPVDPLNVVILPDRLFTSFATCGFVFTSPEVFSGSTAIPLFQWVTLRLQLTEAFLRQFLEFAKTPIWWSDLWLSESVGAFLASSFLPEFEPWLREWLRVVVRSDALGADFSNSVAPVINNELLSRWDIERSVANQTIRNKGLSVLTMWDDTMPEGLVLKTIMDYIQLNKTVMETQDLVNVMVANILADTTYDVRPALSLLAGWLTVPSYPNVNYWPQQDGSFILTQNPGCATASSSGAPVWPVSVSFTQNSSRDWSHYRWATWLLEPSASFAPPQYSADQWAIFNLESAPYRVNYLDTLDHIVAALQTDLALKDTPDSVKAMLSDDVVALSLWGCTTFTQAFSVLNATQRNQLDWYPLAKAFEAITNKIGSNQTVFNNFAMFAATMFTEEFVTSMDPRQSSKYPNLQYVRAVMAPWICELNIGDCREAMAELKNSLLQGDISMIDAGDLENVACYGAHYNINGSAHLALMAAYEGTTSVWFRHLYATGLGCLTHPPCVISVLHTIVNETSPIDLHDAKNIFVGFSGRIEVTDVVIDFIANQAQAIQARLGSDSLSAGLKALSKFSIDLSKLEGLMSLDLGPEVLQATTNAIATANGGINWWATYGPSLEQTINGNAPGPNPPGPPSGGNSTTEPPPSGAAESLHVFSLLFVTVLTFLSISF